MRATSADSDFITLAVLILINIMASRSAFSCAVPKKLIFSPVCLYLNTDNLTQCLGFRIYIRSTNLELSDKAGGVQSEQNSEIQRTRARERDRGSVRERVRGIE